MEYSDLISERRFAQRSASVWRLITPALDLFVRKVNLELYERDERPLGLDTAPARRAFVNELGFNLFSIGTRSNQFGLATATRQAIEATKRVIGRLEARSPELVADPTEVELEDARQQSERLRRYVLRWHPNSRLEFDPEFRGCGIIDACRGDFCVDEWLYEVKAGDRSFRSADFRQLLVYLSLNHQAASRSLNGIGLINPRVGTSFRISNDELAHEISGRPMTDIVAEIVQVISSGDTSR